jgi:hypothetical protein
VTVTWAESMSNAHWRRWLLLVWLLVAASFVYYRWPQISFFVLADTDDNMRMAQVRAWLGGQSWYDLRQYKLDPPGGADIHWTRLVDMPIAGLILLLRPLVGGMIAEKAAITIAPLLALLIAMVGVSLTVRRLFAPAMWLVGIALFLVGASARGMFFPTRIDHHGWQIALLAMSVAGLVDPRQRRGGMTIGIATALSLVIGLEMVPYLALIGAGLALRWLFDAEETPRLRGYGLALASGTAVGFALFASEANRVPRCDALTPAWLSIFVLIGLLVAILSFLRNDNRSVRFWLLAAVGASVCGVMLIFWPHCISRPEGMSPELQRLWFSNVIEVKPSYQQRLPVAFGMLIVPAMGVIGVLFMLFRLRASRDLVRWLPMILLSLGSMVMLLWQSRASPAAQLLSLAGTAALCHSLIPQIARSTRVAVPLRYGGALVAFSIFSGLGPILAVTNIPVEQTSTRQKGIRMAAGMCPTLWALKPVAKLPATTVFTFVDLGPRLIVATHHKAVAGPYHRNGDAILDIHRAFDGTVDNARKIINKHKAGLVLICPNMPESTLYTSRSPGGFYDQLDKGKIPGWLEPIALPERSPFKAWRVKPEDPNGA